MSIENLFNSTEKRKELKALSTAFNAALSAVRSLHTNFGVEGSDEFIKGAVDTYRKLRAGIEEKHTNLEGELTFDTPVRRRAKKNADAAATKIAADGEATKTPPAEVAAPVKSAGAKKGNKNDAASME